MNAITPPHLPEDDERYGVFKPVGHVVISFPGRDRADEAMLALAAIGIDGAAVKRFSDREMLARTAHDIEHASLLANVGQELNLVKAQHALAERGYHFLVVRAGDDDRKRRIAELVREHGAERAQAYGSFIIEELIEHPDDEKQVAESPARGLDAQVPSGDEAERAERHQD